MLFDGDESVTKTHWMDVIAIAIAIVSLYITLLLLY
jgi:hypothetical protein